MGRTISAYIVNFARSGDPNGTGLAAWPRYDATRRKRARAELERILAAPGLSGDLREMVERMLAAG